MKNWLTNVVLGQILHSKKFIYAVTTIVVHLIVTDGVVDEETATNLFYAALIVVIRQGIADSGK